jgi:hypothetical protein
MAAQPDFTAFEVKGYENTEEERGTRYGTLEATWKTNRA